MYLDWLPAIVDRRADVEYVEQGCDSEEEHIFGKVPSRTNPAETFTFVVRRDGRNDNLSYLLPAPKTIVEGSLTEVSILPSRMNRSGRNSFGFGYSSASCIQALFEASACAICSRATKLHHSPDVGYQSGACRDEVASYLVIFDGAMRNTKRSDVVPSERFHDDCLDIHQVITVGQVG